MIEGKSTCCGKCGHVHAKGTSCPRPFLTGKSHCRNRKNEDLRDPDDNPCWDGYHPVGTRQKDGRTVPNCVPVSEELSLEGLWANINAKRARGEKGARKGSEAYKKAVAAGNKLDETEETSNYCPSCLAEYLIEYEHKIEEAEYKGRKVTLGKPFYTPDGPKKRSVYVKNAKGNVVKVNFGDPNMKIKKSIPARRKSFRARHHCENPGPKTKANYWSCKAW